MENAHKKGGDRECLILRKSETGWDVGEMEVSAHFTY